MIHLVGPTNPFIHPSISLLPSLSFSALLCSVLFCSLCFPPVCFCSVSFCFVLLCFCSVLLCGIPSSSLISSDCFLFCSVLFYSELFCGAPVCSHLFSSFLPKQLRLSFLIFSSYLSSFHLICTPLPYGPSSSSLLNSFCTYHLTD